MPALEQVPVVGLSLNTVTLVGRVGEYGVRATKGQTVCAKFAVVLQEAGFDAGVREIYLDVEAWGKAGEGAQGLKAHDAVVVEGQLARSKRRKGEELSWVVVVKARRIQKIDVLAVEEESHT